MNQRYYYLHKADLAQGYPRVKWVSDTQMEDYAERGKQEGVELCEYQGEALPERLIYDPAQGACRVPTEQEKHDLAPACYQSPQGYYVKDEQVRTMPAIPAGMLNPQFDAIKELWAEMATKEQLDTQAASAKKWAYLDELHRYGYARSEHALGLVSDEDMAAADVYLQALAADDESATRPEWFHRYEP